ncbi:MAG: 5'-methylthioadenosine/S-adenosylhomocysteine nucleosidase [Naasia sp.]
MSRDAVVLVAMDEEAAPFLALADEVGEPQKVGFAERRDLRIGDLSILLVRTGIGIVNAASAATAAALDSETPTALISAGTAGGLGDGIVVADVVVGEAYVLADADVRPFGYELGQVPGQPPRHDADEALLASANDGAADLGIHVGLMITADSFTTPERANAALENFPGVLSADMETTAIAQVAHTHGVPFLSVRGISDLCDPVAAASFKSNAPEAARRSAEVVVAALKARAAHRS